MVGQARSCVEPSSWVFHRTRTYKRPHSSEAEDDIPKASSPWFLCRKEGRAEGGNLRVEGERARMVSPTSGGAAPTSTTTTTTTTTHKKTGGGGAGGCVAAKKKELFHVIHKVPAGDSPYVRAKHLQLVEKDQEAAILWFWKAINYGDRVDSALKDMAVVMKQLERADEAIQAIISFRHLCSKQAQESLDNVLIDLYKKCGRIDEQINLLKQKLRMIYLGEAFNGKATKTARSHGKKFQVSIMQETSRILGNLGWAYMQQSNYLAAEAVYRKAQMIDADANKACNLGLCLVRQGRYYDAWSVLEDVRRKRLPGSDDPKAASRVQELLHEIERQLMRPGMVLKEEEEVMMRVELPVIDGVPSMIGGPRTRRLPIFEELSSMRDQVAW